MDQGNARRPAGAVAGPTDEAQATHAEQVADFARRADAAGHTYRETPAVDGVVDASCRCRGWSLWDVEPTRALMAWRFHASPAIVDHEAEAAS